MNLSLQYLIREPKTLSENHPLLLLIHGYGSNEADLFSFASELPDEYFVVSCRAPYDLQYGSYAWYAINFDADQNKFSDHEQAKSSRDRIAQFIDELVENYPVDKSKVTLVGFSQGSVLAYAVALSYPEKIQQVAALSGYLDKETIDLKSSEAYSHLRVYASHGTVDQVIPIDWARRIKPVLDDLGIKNVFSEYPVGHGVAPQNFFDFRNWLLEK